MPSSRENVIRNLQATLESMSEGTGYRFDYHRFYLEFIDRNPDKFPSGMVEVGRESVEARAYPLLERSLEFLVHSVHMAHRDAQDTPSSIASMMIEDVERAVMQDVTRGGNAFETMVTYNERIQVEEPAVYVIVGIQVKYRTNLTDPASVVN